MNRQAKKNYGKIDGNQGEKTNKTRRKDNAKL